MFRNQGLEVRLRGWLDNSGSLRDALSGLNVEVVSAAEARLVCRVLDRCLSVSLIEQYEESGNNLHGAIALFQDTVGAPAVEVLKTQGLPRLRAMVRSYLERRHLEADLILFVAKQLAINGLADDVDIIAVLMRDPECQKNWLWSVVLGALAEHKSAPEQLVAGLGGYIPEGFCRVAYLDFCNAASLSGSLRSHPFNSASGRTMLRAWLESSQEDEASYAHSATAALPFMHATDRDVLLTIALRHSDISVRMEAAWAQARLGDSAGLGKLAEWAGDPRHSKRASKYLQELGHLELVPAEAQEPNFMAMAEMASWLAHPNEYGRAPDEIRVADCRQLYWPPTGDRRWLWVLRFGYRDGDGAMKVGHGLAGSTTWAMMSGVTDGEQDPLDVYGLHCCWELEMNVEEGGAVVGRQLLGEQNPEFRLREV